MKRTKIFARLLGLILIIGAVAAGAGFGQNSKSDARRLRRDVEQLTRAVKASERGAYLVRFETDAETSALYFKPKKRLWDKLSEAEKLAAAGDWWRKWRVISGANDSRIQFMKNTGAEEIICLLEGCYVPACGL